MGTVRQALFHKQGLLMPDRRIPTLHQGRLSHPINESIRPATVRSHCTDQANAIPNEIEGHRGARLGCRAMRATGSGSVRPRQPSPCEGKSAVIGDLLWVRACYHNSPPAIVSDRYNTV